MQFFSCPYAQILFKFKPILRLNSVILNFLNEPGQLLFFCHLRLQFLARTRRSVPSSSTCGTRRRTTSRPSKRWCRSTEFGPLPFCPSGILLDLPSGPEVLWSVARRGPWPPLSPSKALLPSITTIRFELLNKNCTTSKKFLTTKTSLNLKKSTRNRFQAEI